MSKTKRTIPPEAAMPLGFIRKLPRRSHGPKKYPHAKLRSALQHYINRHPGLTSDTKRVGCLLSLWYRPGRVLHPSLATIADELSISTDTVSVAVATLHNLELVFVKSGGFGAMANEYIPNYWLVLNSATGAVMKEAEYDFSAGKWRTSAKSVTEIPVQKPVTEIPEQDTPQERRISAKSVTEIPVPCSDSVMSGAIASPASAGATADCATAPRENNSEKQKPKNNSGKIWVHPRDEGMAGETREVFLKLENLNIATGVDPGFFLSSIGTGGFVGGALEDLCTEFLIGRNPSNPIQDRAPDGVSATVFIDMIAGNRVYRETLFGLNPEHVTGKDYVCIDLWVPETFEYQPKETVATHSDDG